MAREKRTKHFFFLPFKKDPTVNSTFFFLCLQPVSSYSLLSQKYVSQLVCKNQCELPQPVLCRPPSGARAVLYAIYLECLNQQHFVCYFKRGWKVRRMSRAIDRGLPSECCWLLSSNPRSQRYFGDIKTTDGLWRQLACVVISPHRQLVIF